MRPNETRSRRQRHWRRATSHLNRHRAARRPHPPSDAGYDGDAGGNFGWDRNLHLVERFRLFDADTLLYLFEIDNPTAFTRPWKGELTMARTDGRIYEFAWHEGNDSLENTLRGYRATEGKPTGTK